MTTETLGVGIVDLVTTLEALEWRPDRNAAGGLTAFCPICHATPTSVRLNRRTQRDDGHRTEMASYSLDGHAVIGLCPLAAALDQARALRDAARNAER